MRYFKVYEIALFLVLTPAAFAAASVTLQSDPLAERLTAVIDPQIHSGKTVGLAVGVFDSQGPRFYSFGETRRGSATRPNQDTLFEIGSITKTFTALLLGDAVVRGEAAFSDPVDRFIPELKGHYAGSITLDQLVTHTSGLPLLPCNLSAAGTSYANYDEKDLLAGLTDSSLASPGCGIGSHPSERITYSNWGTALLGYVLGRARGSTYPQLLSQRITSPLQLNDTVIFPSSRQKVRLAQGYDEKGGETSFSNRRIMFGNGALIASARDLFRYLALQLNPVATPLAQAVKLSHQPRFYDGRSIIGLGWFIWNPETPDSSLHQYSHDGSTSGYTSSFFFDTAAQRGMFYLSNSAFRPSCIQAAVEGRACTP